MLDEKKKTAETGKKAEPEKIRGMGNKKRGYPRKHGGLTCLVSGVPLLLQATVHRWGSLHCKTACCRHVCTPPKDPSHLFCTALDVTAEKYNIVIQYLVKPPSVPNYSCTATAFHFYNLRKVESHQNYELIIQSKSKL